MEDLSFYFVTVFNVNFRTAFTPKHDGEEALGDFFDRVVGEDRLSTDFINSRLRLLKKFTLQSLEAQTNQKFKWLIIIDPETPNNVKFPSRATLLKASQGALYTTVADFIKADCKTNWAVSCNLDSDDAFSTDWVQSIYDMPRQKCLVDADKILKINTKLNVCFLQQNPFYCAAAFAVMEEVGDSLITCVKDAHVRMHKYKLPNIKLNSYFLQTVHEHNLLTKMRPTSRQVQYHLFTEYVKLFGFSRKQFQSPLRENNKGFIGQEQYDEYMKENPWNHRFTRDK